MSLPVQPKNIFLNNHLATLKTFVRRDTLLAFDFDGTLAPITDHPEDSFMSDNVLHLLTDLSNEYNTVIISGRARTDLLHRVPKSLKAIIGNHGFEGLPYFEEFLADPTITEAPEKWLEQLHKTLQLSDGVWLENKGKSISIHYRHSADPDRAYEMIKHAVTKLTPQPRQVGGKFVVNLIPENLPHKGHAILELMKHFKSENAVFFGDDVTDEDVFELDDKRIFKIRVGLNEASHAEYYIPSQSEIAEVLTCLKEIR